MPKSPSVPSLKQFCGSRHFSIRISAVCWVQHHHSPPSLRDTNPASATQPLLSVKSSSPAGWRQLWTAARLCWREHTQQGIPPAPGADPAPRPHWWNWYFSWCSKWAQSPMAAQWKQRGRGTFHHSLLWFHIPAAMHFWRTTEMCSLKPV